jgi:mannose-6-phosphate isomerase-like protein (cupin superfamily)
MENVAVTLPSGGESIDLGAIQIRVLEDGSTTGHRIGIVEIRVPPHTEGPPQHYHARHDEGFYVVSGTAVFTVGDTHHQAPAGTLVMVPPGAPHTFANPGDEVCVLLNTFTPDLYVQYFRDVRAMVDSGQPLSPASLTQVMRRYETFPAADPALQPLPPPRGQPVRDHRF